MHHVIRRTSTLLVAVVLAASVTLAGAAPATAATVTKNDKVGDAPAYLDIASVTYRNTKRAVSARIRVPGLERRGQALLVMGPPNSDFGYEAVVRIDRDGDVKKRFALFNNEDTTKVKCDVKVKWVASKNFIKISVPQSCVDLGTKRLYISASTGKWVDRARPARSLRRG